VFNAKDPAGAAAAYMGEHYIQHNPQARDGYAGFLEFMQASQQRAPRMRSEIQRIVAEGDLVVTHSRMTVPEAPTRAIVDIWRLERGKIVEHWDVIRPVPDTAANDNTMF
jgi:predicted SnoaL-like aldol condensation-catalyzing enzyme